jgi:hypothetical protein
VRQRQPGERLATEGPSRRNMGRRDTADATRAGAEGRSWDQRAGTSPISGRRGQSLGRIWGRLRTHLDCRCRCMCKARPIRRARTRRSSVRDIYAETLYLFASSTRQSRRPI